MSSSMGRMTSHILWTKKSSKPPTSNHKWHKWFMRFTKLESCWNLIYKALITISIPFFPAIFIPSPERCHGATWLEGCSSNFRGSGAEARRARNSARKPNMESLRRWEHLGTIHGKSWEMMENHGKIMENDGKSWEMMGKWWENDKNMMGKSWENHGKSTKKWHEHLYNWLFSWYNLSLPSGNLTVCYGKWPIYRYL